MLNFFYLWTTYRNLKSGFLCDFLFKNASLTIMRFLFWGFGWFLFDKFLIEYISTRLPAFAQTKLNFLGYFFYFSFPRLLTYFILFLLLICWTYILFLF